MPLNSGTRLGPYEILSSLGAGGMGEVYRARDTRLSRDVALKILSPRVAGDAGRRARFESEARTAGSLNHPNIVAVFDFGQHLETAYIVSELVEGESLRVLLGRGPLPVRKAVDIGVQIADGLAAAHAAGIVHRDVKPENVMITRDGRVKLLDFGLARQLFPSGQVLDEHDSTLTDEGVLLGTLGYMSPEQVRGKPVDQRSDMFSLGTILYEMLSGRRAFDRPSPVETLHAIITADPPEFGAGAGIPLALESIVRHCMEKAEQERFQSAWDLAFALEAFSGHSLSDRVSVPGGRHLGRRRTMGVLVLSSFLAGALITYLAVRVLSQERHIPAKALYAQITNESGAELFPSLSPDGRFLAFASRSPGNWSIYLQGIADSEPVNLTADSVSDNTQPALSPDGKLIAFRSEREGGGVFLMNVAGKSIRRLTDSGYNPAWSPDGREILCADESITRPEDRQMPVSRLWAVDVATGTKRLVSPGDVVQPQWSPHGQRIAYWAIDKSGHRDIWTIPARGGTPVPVTHDDALDWSPAWSPDGKYLYFSSDRAAGMTLWRAPINESSGRVLGPLEPVRTPSRYAGHLSFARDGHRMAYVQASFSANLRRVVFDPVTERVLDEPKDITEPTREATRPAISPDGEWLAFNSAGVEEDLFLVRADGTGLRQLTHEGHKDRGPRWSPDGQRIAFFSKRSGNSEIWTVSVDGRAEQVTFLAGPNVNWPIWSPDGRSLVYTIFGLGSFMVDIGKSWARQTPVELAPWGTSGEQFSAWSWSPNGQKLAGFLQRADGTYAGIALYDVASRSYEKLTDSGIEPVWLSDSRRLLFNQDGKIQLVDSRTKRAHEALSVAPAVIARRGFAIGPGDRSIYFSVANTEADVWLLMYD
ncbi:MAG TPA: protein kinase [Bryobacteraceae bacterium]|jgi:serine/threonine protein kinase|nr:protein kinase [Bryobacteraceae bacterium]